MTEAEWLACEDPEKLFAQAERTHRASQRVFRLFCAGFWRWQEKHWVGSGVMPPANRDLLRERVDSLEQWAETDVPPKFLDRMIGFFNPRARVAARGTVTLARQWVDLEGGAAVPHVLCSLVREVFGNPFRRVKVNRAWRTSTVVALTKGLYDEKAFDRMPILADALQDAGCDSDDILNHCRDPNQLHVRGCWVVDLVLGNS